MNLSKNAVRKNDITQPNVYANFFSPKEEAKSETKKEEPVAKDRGKFLEILRQNLSSSSEAALKYCGKMSLGQVNITKNL
jgi:hypothetical protein